MDKYDPKNFSLGKKNNKKNTWYEKVATFQNGVNAIYSCAMKCDVPLVKYIQGKSSMVDPNTEYKTN